MNIFYLDKDPRVCAEMHNDKHVIKMILESAQLLSTAHRVLDGTESIVKSKTNRNVKRWILPDERDTILYSATHMNHPSAIWCRQSKNNYVWLFDLFCSLIHEYWYRYGKTHKCASMIDALANIPNNLADIEFTQPTPAMPKEVIIKGDSIASYRNYYINNKQHLASWSGKINSRNVPEWFNA
jgi:hypothetical protein